MNKLVVRRRPLNPFRVNSFPTLFPSNFFDEFDRLLAGLGDFDSEHGNLSLRKGFPKGDVYTEDGNVIIELALAGYNKEQLSVRIEDNSLVVSAEKVDEPDNNNGRSLARRAFSKVFPNFTNEWNLESADVSYRDGLLRIVVPPHEEPSAAVTELEIK